MEIGRAYVGGSQKFEYRKIGWIAWPVDYMYTYIVNEHYFHYLLEYAKADRISSAK